MREWLEKGLEEYEDGDKHVQGQVWLTASRTDQDWWQELYRLSRAGCFLRGRLRFGASKLGAPFPSTVFWLKESGARAFVAEFKSLGITWQRPRASR
jgi:hypothetical protein